MSFLTSCCENFKLFASYIRAQIRKRLLQLEGMWLPGTSKWKFEMIFQEIQCNILWFVYHFENYGFLTLLDSRLKSVSFIKTDNYMNAVSDTNTWLKEEFSKELTNQRILHWIIREHRHL